MFLVFEYNLYLTFLAISRKIVYFELSLSKIIYAAFIENINSQLNFVMERFKKQINFIRLLRGLWVLIKQELKKIVPLFSTSGKNNSEKI